MVSQWIKNKIKSCWLLLISLPLTFLQGQNTDTPLFNLTTEDYNDLPLTCQSEVDLIQEDESLLFQAFGTYSAIDAIQSAGMIYVSHPLTGQDVYFQVRYTEFFEEGYYWYGEAYSQDANAAMEYGTLYFTKYNDYVFGSMAWPEEVFQFESVGMDRIMIYQLAENEDLGCGHITEENIASPALVPPVHHCNVDIVALYTENFRKKIDGGGIGNTNKTKAIIRSKIAEANGVMGASGLDVYFKFNLVGIVASEFVEDEIIIVDEKEEHLNPSSQNGEMYNARQNYNADISIIFTHGKYEQDSDGDGEGDGRIGGTVGSILLNSSLSYVLIEKKGLKNKKKNTHTTAHELSHIMQATHNNTDAGALTYGSFIETPRAGTQLIFTHNGSLMQAGPIGGVIHRPRLSNPDILLEGAFLGIADERDNARVVSEKVCTVADFITDTSNPGSVDISFYHGPFCTCNPSVEMMATPHFGNPPYTYAWESSEDGGFNFSTFGGNEAQPNYIPPCGMEDEITVVIKVSVMDNSGSTVVGTRNLHLHDPLECRDEDDRGQYRYQIASAGFRLLPNPVNNLLAVEGEIPEKWLGQKAKLSIYALNGQLQHRITLKFITTNYSKSIDVSTLVAGGYLVKVEIEKAIIFSDLLIKE